MTAPPTLGTAAPNEHEIVVNVADFAVARQRGILVTAGLGSCVAIALYDRASRVGALAHILLPDGEQSGGTIKPAKFPSTAVPLLVAEMRRLGATGPFSGKIAGGARMFGSLLASGVNMGERNVDATRRALKEAGIRLIAEDVGGEHGRSVYFDVRTGQIRVHSLQRGDRVI
jgi:chemotaxis protein CheD